MAPLRLRDDDAAALRAFILLQRYTLGLNRVTDQWLGDEGSDNHDVQVLLAVRASAGIGPSELVSTLRMPRSTLARGVARLLERGLVERRVDAADRRRAGLHLTPSGSRAVERLGRSLADFFGAGEPTVKEVILLLGGDPEAGPHDTHTDPLDVLGSMTATGAAYGRDLLPKMHAFDLADVTDRWAVMILAEGWARPSSLADQLGLSPAGTTSLIERLEEAGLAVRQAGVLDSDRRAVLVHLTPRGRRAARTVLAVFRDHEGALVETMRPTLAFARPSARGARRSA